jgi:molybdopterin molybdotransferase
MLAIEEAQRIITAHVQPLPTEQVESLTAEGRVLAEDLFAPEAIPDVAKATVDGYALRSADGMRERSVVGELVAGTAERITVEPRTAVPIMTGAPVPAGADAVIMIEQTEEHAGVLRIRQPVQVGENIRSPGDDMAQGEALLARGTTLRPWDIALLASVGFTTICVYRRPRVAVLSTGNEVVEPDAPRAAGMVRDSNRYALLAAVREAGAEALSLGIAHDDPHVQREALQRGIAQADVLITSGGVSMGTRDLLKPLLRELGTIHFGRVASRPGKPVTFATARQTLIFGMPGFPVSSLVAFETYVRPALRRLQGDAHPERPRVRVVLAEPIRAPHDRPEFQRAVVSWREGRLVAHSTGRQISTRLLSLRGANALLLVPAGEGSYQPGEELEAMLIAPLLHMEALQPESRTKGQQ